MPRKRRAFYVVTLRSRRQRRSPPAIRNPEAAFKIIRPLVRDLDREHFYAIYLTTRQTVLRVDLVSVGSLDASIVHPREVFKPALALSAAALVVCHNHPSGDPEPSGDDLEITERLEKAGDLLGIELVDHLVIGGGRFVSLKERGVL